MEPSRRDLLIGLTAATIAPACKQQDRGDDDSTAPGGAPVPAADRPDEPAPWQAPGTEDEVAFPLGVQSGDATDSGILISVVTEEAGCTLVVMAQDGDAWAEVQRHEGQDSDGHRVALELTGLSPDTAHTFALLASDGARRSAVGRFRTAPGADSPPRKLVFGASSCWGSSNPSFANLQHAADAQLDAMFLLGDTIYGDASDTLDDYRRTWANALGKEHPKALFASTSIVATWDDHEVDNNWYEGVTVSSERVQTGTTAFREAIPQRVGPSGSGFWRVLSWGPALDLFVLDCRGERAYQQKMLSDAQLDAMVSAVEGSSATFKIVLTSVHLTDHSALLGGVESIDRWQGYEAQREALIKACESVPGVIVITGDMHYSATQLLGRAGEPGEGIVELAAGPAGSTIFPLQPMVELAVDEAKAQYLWTGDTHTVTLLTLDPGLGEAVAQFVDDAGTVLYEHRWTP